MQDINKSVYMIIGITVSVLELVVVGVALKYSDFRLLMYIYVTFFTLA